MNSYSIGIVGSWWLITLLLILALGLSFFLYRKTIPPISPRQKLTLIILRTLALGLLLFVIFEPVLTIISGTQEDPIINVMFDNSISVAQKDASVDRKAQYKQVIENIDFNKISANNIKFNKFDTDIKEYTNFQFDSLSFKGQLTDISKAIKYTTQESTKQNIRAMILVTDGSFNSGDNPVYATDDFGKPLYIIGIGDTLDPKDISIQSVLTNEIAYIDNPIPVIVNVKTSGFKSGEVKLNLYDNDFLISNQTLYINPDADSYQSVFEYLPKQDGIRKLTVTASSLDGEITTKNNKMSEFVNVLKNKRNICLFAGAPSADVSFLTNTFLKEKGVEVKHFIQKKNAEFYTQPSKYDLQNSELIVLIGFPIASTPQSVIDMIRNELENGKPMLFVASKELDYTKLRTLSDYLPFSVVSSRQQEFLASPDFQNSEISNPLLRVTGNDDDLKLWNKLPPVFKTETFVKPNPESSIISKIKVNNVSIDQPLILSRSFQNKKTVAILGYGIYRWKMLDYASNVSNNKQDAVDLFTTFLQNTYKWLSVPQDRKNIQIKTTKRNYTIGEKVEFYAQIYDAAFTPVDNANINLKLSSGNQVRDLYFKLIGNGRYYSSADGLSEGDYYFTGDVFLNNRKLGSDNGRFNIGDIPLEYKDLKMNINLLRTLANRSGGKFYLPGEANQVINDIKSNSTFQSTAVTRRYEHLLWNLTYFLAASILLFATEWFLRKRYGMI